MMALPPPDGPAGVDRRKRDRRVSDRRKAAKAKGEASAEPSGPGAPGFTDAAAGEEGGPRARGRSAGRRRTDREREPEPKDFSPSRSAAKPHAPLVAQLIATALDLEQTRVKRRGSQDEATALYARKAKAATPTRGDA